jgi:hypothetical protein
MRHPWLPKLNPRVSKKLLTRCDFFSQAILRNHSTYGGGVLHVFWRCVDSLTDPSLHSDTFGPNAQGLLHGPKASPPNAWDDPKVAAAIEATGRKKLIIAGLSLEVCAAFPAITAVGKGYDAYVAVDASGTFSDTKRNTGLLRMQQAGVILSDYATVMIEILKDNARPEAAAVYAALDMPWATLVGQISKAYSKQSAVGR